MTPSEARRKVRPAAAWALAVAAAFAVSVWWHWFIGDDAYISFRYAQHLVQGHGLVFNPGEYVEGYTNFSWVLVVAAGMALGLDPEVFSLWLGVACGAGVLAVVARHGSRRWGWDSPWTWLAPLCLAVNRSFGAWSTGGLETQAFTLLVVAAFVALFHEDETSEPRPWRSSGLFALATLTRPEGALFYGLAWLALGARVATKRRTPAALGWFSLVYAPVVGTHEAWRLWYYGAPVPNTFYAKVSGAWWSQGFDYLGFFATQHVLVVALALLVAGLALAPRFDVVVTTVVLAVYGTYLAYVGGDRFEFRLVSHALPFLYLLAAYGLWALAARYGTGSVRSRATVGAVGAALVLTAFLPTLTTQEAEFPEGVNSIENIGAYAARRAREGRVLADLREDGYLDDDLVIAVTGAGALPYFAGFETVDLHGLNDVTIARQVVEERGEIGHEKYAPVAYLVERGVVIWDVRNYVVQQHRKDCPVSPIHESGRYTGPIRCIEAEGRYLAFATTLDDDAFRRRFARFRIVY